MKGSWFISEPMMFVSQASVLLAFFAGNIAAAIGPVATLNIANSNISPDGYTPSAVLVGSTFPGPMITGTKGDNFRINVVNGLTDVTMDKTTSIVHWHGIFQHGTAWTDGASMVTQCPIASGNSFLYNFNVPAQAGTYWYHSHLLNQYCDRLRGAFIVYDPNDPHRHLYDIDNESTIITLADWYHVPSPQEGPVPTPDSTLINGLGRYLLGPPSPLAVVNVQAVIEVDGENVEPIDVDSIRIFASQRYSFVVWSLVYVFLDGVAHFFAQLNANQEVVNYWIRANPSTGAQGYLGGLNSAILRYAGAPVDYPTTTLRISTSPLRVTDLHPGHLLSSLQWLTEISLQNPLTLQFLVNGVPLVSPSVPVLLQILSGATSATSLLPSGSVYTLPANKVIEITIPGGLLTSIVGAPHPFHLHGHTFSVTRSAGSLTYNYHNPVRRDTVSTGILGDDVTIRFVTDNPGPWFLHCHIDWHLNAGLAVVMVEEGPHIAAANPAPESWENLCPIYDSLTQFDNLKGSFDPMIVIMALVVNYRRNLEAVAGRFGTRLWSKKCICVWASARYCCCCLS